MVAALPDYGKGWVRLHEAAEVVGRPPLRPSPRRKRSALRGTPKETTPDDQYLPNPPHPCTAIARGYTVSRLIPYRS